MFKLKIFLMIYNKDDIEKCLNQTLNKTESYINWTRNKVSMPEIFVDLTCINQTPVYSEDNGHSVYKGFTVLQTSNFIFLVKGDKSM
jgi:ribosome biogenesis protein Tsr3